MADDPEVLANQEDLLQTLFDTLRTVARGTGTFPSDAARDAAIRTCARVQMIFLRNRLGYNDEND